MNRRNLKAAGVRLLQLLPVLFAITFLSFAMMRLAGSDVVLKVIIESEQDFAWAEENARRVGRYCRLYLQPEWSRYEAVLPAIVQYAKAHPRWSISVQTHKFMHIP